MIYSGNTYPKARAVMITGHRPKSMQWSYNLEDPKWQALSAMLENILINTGCSDAWTGMALGADTVFAKAIIALKDRGCPIRLHCAIPFCGQESKWPQRSVSDYHAILSRADETVIVSPGGYASHKMTERDHYMADRSDLVIAVWNGSISGTGRCVQYASNHGKDILRINPGLF